MLATQIPIVHCFIFTLQLRIFRSELKPTETIEKVALPDDEVISSEKQHQELITGVQAGVDLKKTDTREPINPLDLAKLETSKDQVEEEIQAFDRYLCNLGSCLPARNFYL